MSAPTCFTPGCGAEFVSTDPSWQSSTLVGYYSPPGHTHDDNCTSRPATCANGHHHPLSIRRRCPKPGCDWVGRATCFCHEGPKVDQWPGTS